MNFPELFFQLKAEEKVNLIDPVEDFRDIFQERSKRIKKPVSTKKLVEFIKGDKEIYNSLNAIPENGNLRKTVARLAIEEFLSS